MIQIKKARLFVCSHEGLEFVIANRELEQPFCPACRSCVFVEEIKRGPLKEQKKTTWTYKNYQTHGCAPRLGGPRSRGHTDAGF